MAKRRGVFIGGYVSPDLAEAVKTRARAAHHTVSQELRRIIEEVVKGPRLPVVADRKAFPAGPIEPPENASSNAPVRYGSSHPIKEEPK